MVRVVVGGLGGVGVTRVCGWWGGIYLAGQGKMVFNAPQWLVGLFGVILGYFGLLRLLGLLGLLG